MIAGKAGDHTGAWGLCCHCPGANRDVINGPDLVKPCWVVDGAEDEEQAEGEVEQE